MEDSVTRVRLTGTDSVKSVDKETYLDLEVKSTYGKLRNTEIASDIDLMDLFEKERNSCTNYRLTLTINPFCSNVLFNMCTEIVENEGSYEQKPIVDQSGAGVSVPNAYGKDSGVLRSDMVNNTEYSREGLTPNTYSYHPGVDIFNNHIIRNKTGRIVNGYTTAPNPRNIFNTLEDVMRNYDGSVVTFRPRRRLDSYNIPVEIDKHLYQKGDLMGLSCDDGDEDLTAIDANLRDENGWYGFDNTAVIDAKSPTDDDVLLDINRVINDHGDCEFIDMYPDRTLFSFTPKLNTYKNRLEYNWDIEVTYPYRNFFAHPLVTDGEELNDGTWKQGDLNAMRLLYGKYVVMPSGRYAFLFRSCVPHGLTSGDRIILYYKPDGVNEQYHECAETCITSVFGDIESRNKEYFFSFYSNSIFDGIVGGDVIDKLYTEVNNPQNPNDYTLFSKQLTHIPDGDPKYDYIKFYVYEVEPCQGGYYDETNTYYEIPTVTSNTPDHIRVIDNHGDITCYERVLKYYDFNGAIDSDFDITNEINRILAQYEFRYNRVVSNVKSQYYFRIFHKLPNLSHAHDELTENESSDSSSFERFIAANASHEDEITHGLVMDKFDNEWYDMAFAKTIYGDQITQVTYTEPCDIKDLVDNLGRPVLSLYATIVKKNNGYEKWYGQYRKEDGYYGTDDIEYSHCFGKVTSGLPFLMHDEDYDLNLRAEKAWLSDAKMLTNIEIDGIQSKSLEDWIGKSDGVNGLLDNEFFGDVVEFNPVDGYEKVLEVVNFRFNTAQREAEEIVNDNQYVFYTKNIKTDDYTYIEDEDETFSVETKPYPSAIIHPEGYHYKAHYEMRTKELGEKHQDSHYRLRADTSEVCEIDGERYIMVDTVSRHKCTPGDVVYFCDDEDGVWYDGKIVYTPDMNTLIASVVTDIGDVELNTTLEELSDLLNNGDAILRRRNPSIPSYAVRVAKNDFIWRDINNVGDVRNQLLPEYPFTNGNFYVDRQINFFLKRQDPTGVNGLYFHSDDEQIANPYGDVIKSRNTDYVSEARMTC